MKRILLLIIAFAVAAYAGWYYWNLSQQVSSAPVASLLPRQTIFLADMPDFNRTLAEWRQSDVYQLYREPAVQDFLRKPLANVQKQNPISETLRWVAEGELRAYGRLLRRRNPSLFARRVSFLRRRAAQA